MFLAINGKICINQQNIRFVDRYLRFNMKWGVTPKSFILIGLSLINHPAIGVLPWLRKPPYKPTWICAGIIIEGQRHVFVLACAQLFLVQQNVFFLVLCLPLAIMLAWCFQGTFRIWIFHLVQTHPHVCPQGHWHRRDRSLFFHTSIVWTKTHNIYI